MEPRCSSNGDVPTSKEMVDRRTAAGVPSIALNPHFIEWSLHLSAILEWRSYKGWWGCVLAMVCPVSMLFSGDSFRGSLVVVPWPVSCIILKLYKLCVPSYLVSLCYVICGLSHLLMKVQDGILPTVVLIKKWCKGHDSSKNIAIIHLPIYRYELLLK